MKDRILQFLESERISPAEFADKIGVQRSSMSHILNGRNYPSASFIQKMLQVYPLVNSRWLMIGEGPMNLESIDTKELPASKSLVFSTDKIKETIITSDLGLSDADDKVTENDAFLGINGVNQQSDKNKSDFQGEVENVSQQDGRDENDFQIINDSKEGQPSNQSSFISAGLSGGKEIEQVLFFYTDKTFKVYRPS